MAIKRKTDEKRDDGKIKWVKEGGGSLRLTIDGKTKIIKPGKDGGQGQTFFARPEEVPMAFRDVVKPLGDLPPEPEDIQLDAVKTNYTLKSKGGGWYDVLGAEGKPVNEKSLKKEDAQKLIDELGG